MAISCGDPERLIEYIKVSYPKATFSEANAIGTIKVTFPDGHIVNVFANGTVNFQGKASKISDQIKAQIDIINENN